MSDSTRFLCEAIELARENLRSGGLPYGAVVVRNGEVVASGVNELAKTNDPTAHAELVAVRAASRALGSPSLEGCTVYASGHPCPMCMAAMRVAGIGEIYYAYSNDDAAPYGMSSADAYADLAKPFAEQSMTIRYVPVRLDSGPDIYDEWKARQAQ